MKNAYLIVSDLHISCNNKPHRVDYHAEIVKVLKEIIDLSYKYKSKDYNLNIVFLGDIFDRSFSNSFIFAYYQNFFIDLCSYCKLYVNFGNHEFSFYKDNPFWTLIKNIPSRMVSGCLTASYQPSGYSDYINVVDRIDDGEVHFFFNHYNAVQHNVLGEDGIKIGLFHEHFSSPYILSSMVSKGCDFNGYKVEDIENCNFLRGYNYCFAGHNHSIYGKWSYVSKNDELKRFELYHLCSLGRSKENEVNDNLLERNIPCILVEEGKLISVEDNLFNLPSRSECITPDTIKNVQVKKDLNREIKEIRSVESKGENPCDEVREILIANGSDYINFFNEILSSNNSSLEREFDSIYNSHYNWRF